MSPNDFVEASGATVEAAIQDALSQLGATEDDVVIEVLSTPRSGVLGLGARAAKVRITRRQPSEARSAAQSPPAAPPLAQEAQPVGAQAKALEPGEPKPASSDVQAAGELKEEGLGEERTAADLAEQGGEAAGILRRILELMGEKAEVVEAEKSSQALVLEIRGDGSGILIGRRGQTLDALEYLVNRVLARRVKDAVPVMLDTESYRARRQNQLHRMALSMAERAKREHRSVSLDPMSPRDRRVIHLALQGDPLVTTRSSGDGFLRAIEISPVESSGERGRQPQGGPVGQQGGFKRGQKKII